LNNLKDVKVEPCHDRNGIQLLLPDDMVELTVREGEKLLKLIERGLVEARKEPKAPRPFFTEDLKGDKEEFAYTTACRKNYLCMITIKGEEFDIDQCKELKNWLDRVIKYHSENKSDHGDVD